MREQHYVFPIRTINWTAFYRMCVVGFFMGSPLFVKDQKYSVVVSL